MMTLADLAQPTGIAHLVEVTGGTQSFYNQPSRAGGVMQVAQAAIKDNPNAAHLKVRIVPNLPNAYWNSDRNEIILGLVNPDALAHELGHANNVKQDGLYKKVLNAANGVVRLNNLAAIPTVLALRAFIQDKEKRDDILKVLAMAASAAAAPGIMEEATASTKALYNAPDKAQAIKTLLPAFLSHTAVNMASPMIFQAGRLL